MRKNKKKEQKKGVYSIDKHTPQVYHVNMKKNIAYYRKSNTIYSDIFYHIIFCTRYKRKIFLVNDIKDCVNQILTDQCSDMKVNIIKLTIYENYVDIMLESPPDINPKQIVFRLKKASNISSLKEKFPVLSSMPNVWTWGCLISTRKISDLVIEQYISIQKNKN